MKNIFILSFICANVFSQPAPGQQQKNTCKTYVKTTVGTCNEKHWNNVSNGRPDYEVFIEKDVHAMFAGGTWIGGLDPGGLLHIDADTFKQNNIGCWPGPLDTTDIPAFSSGSLTPHNRYLRVDC